jgi:hypothetical protein
MKNMKGKLEETLLTFHLAQTQVYVHGENTEGQLGFSI